MSQNFTKKPMPFDKIKLTSLQKRVLVIKILFYRALLTVLSFPLKLLPNLVKIPLAKKPLGKFAIILTFILIFINFSVKSQTGYWSVTSNSYDKKFSLTLQVEDGTRHVTEMKLKANGKEILIVVEDNDSYQTSLSYVNLDDMQQAWDGYSDPSFGSFSFSKSDGSPSDYIYADIIHNITEPQVIKFDADMQFSDGSSSSSSKSVYFINNDFPGPENFKVASAGLQAKLTWVNSAFYRGYVKANSHIAIPFPVLPAYTVPSRIKIERNDTLIQTLTNDTTTVTFTDTQYGSKYSIYYEIDYEKLSCAGFPLPTCSYVFKATYKSKKAGGDSEPLPLVKAPVGVKATKDQCDGKVIVTWDYTGDTDPQNFIIAAGSTNINVAADIREYVDSIGLHTSQDYTITAVGTLNSVASSSAHGTTSGIPTQPGSFTATIIGNSIQLSWQSSQFVNKYLVRRNSTSGSTDIEVNNTATGTIIYDDNTVKGCELYKYELYAANECTDVEGISGIKAVNEPQVKIRPDLTAYLTSFDGSKSYFPDKVAMEWTVQADNFALVDYFEIYRRQAGTPSAFQLIGTVKGEAAFDDKTAIGGIFYEYQLVAKVDCGGELLQSNIRTAYGFRLPYGVVNGHIEYENGVAVKGVEVLASKASGSVISNSLQFTGTGSVTVNDNARLKPSNAIVIEAWIKPANVTETVEIINKLSGSNGFRLTQNNNDIEFRVNVGGIKTVAARNILVANQFTHVAGVYDGKEVKIFINGRIPFDVYYVFTSTTFQTMLDMSIEADVVDNLRSLLNLRHPTYQEFYNNIIYRVGEPVAERYLPLIIPLTRIEVIRAGTILATTGTISHSTNPIVFCNAFKGNIDEIRIWNRAKTNDEILFDYKRIVAGDAVGIAGYWRCDENFGSMVYDAAKSDGIFHKNNGAFAGTVSFSASIPNTSQLGWIGITDAFGDYTIPYIPYFGTGENFDITPRFEQHVFKPGSKTVFIGEGANILNSQDFIDISSFKITGTVYYENTFCGVEGTLLTIDGDVIIKDGQPVMTDPKGEFEISVPVGNHYISVRKNGHHFKSFKFPPGPESVKFDFQEDINGINFLDQTKVTVVGRVVGGAREGDKKPGLGLSKNNIGVANFKFISAQGCTYYSIKTNSKTGEFAIDVPPMKYIVQDFTVPKNPKVDMYFTEFPEADFSIVAPDQVSEHTFEGPVNAHLKLDKKNFRALLEIEGLTKPLDVEMDVLNQGTEFEKGKFYYNAEAYEYPLENKDITIVDTKFKGNGAKVSMIYNYRYDLIYRSVPNMLVTLPDGVSEFKGDNSISYEDRITHTKKQFNVEKYPFQYPIINQGNDYQLLISVDEVFYNQDTCPSINGCPQAIMDRVPVDDGFIKINNQLANEVNPSPLQLTEGKVLYTFKGGEPQTLTDGNYPWRNYSGALNITAVINEVGFPWEPYKDLTKLPFTTIYSNFPQPDDKYFRGYVIGVNPVQGSDFVTSGPAVVDMILRDPPGSESYSYMQKGSTFTTSEVISGTTGISMSNDFTVGLGTQWMVGLGFSTETEMNNDVTLGIAVNTSIGNEGEMVKSVSLNESWQTSASPDLVGAPSDLFFGSSSNYIVSLADNLTIFPVDFAKTNGVATAGNEAGPDGQKFTIGINKALMAAPDGFPTYFLYTSDHIENTLIPFIKKIRNNLFIEKANKYTTKIPADHEMYGKNNDDPRWINLNIKPSSENYITTEDPLDFDGPGYTFKPKDKKDKDEIRKYNEQIRLWEEALARNEMEKYNAKLVNNVSFNAGPTYDHSITNTLSSSYTTSFELEVGGSIAWEIGGEVGGVGISNALTIGVSKTTGRTNTTSKEMTNTFGYVLSDPDVGDYFSVDIKDPGTGTGPVFGIKGGRSMCPYEDKVEVNYYKPASHNITDQIISKFQKLGVDAKLLKLLSWDKKGKFKADELKSSLGLELENSIVDIVKDKKFEVPQIKNRQFQTTTDLREAVYQIIDLSVELNPADKTSNDIINQSGQIKGMGEYISSGDGIMNFYLIKESNRNELKSEFERYRSYIYDLSAKPVKEPQLLGEATIMRENPVASITPNEQYNVPEDNKAYFTMQLGNNSNSEEDMTYLVRVLEETNPDGAVILCDGVPLNRTFDITFGQLINKTISVQMGKADVYDYEDIKLVLSSVCQSGDIADTVTFSVHFVPSCTEIDVMRPKDQFVINSEDEHLVDGVRETKVPIILTGYDLNNSIFDRMSFQFKFIAEPDWIIRDTYYKNPKKDDQKPIPGSFTGLEWDLSGYPDGQYQIRGKTTCGLNPDGTEIFDLSEVWTGTIDRKAPQVFGSPQPADGILSPDDNIRIEFNETIFGEKLTKLENFDIRGKLNGTDLRHDVAVKFDGNKEDFIRIPDGLSLANKSFTVEFWLKPDRTNINECILSQYSDPKDAIYIGLSNKGQFVLQVGSEVFEPEELSVPTVVGQWHHYAFVYDHVRKEATLFMDGAPVSTGLMNANYSGFGDVVIGKSLSGEVRPFKGDIHELRIWERPRNASKLASNMLISLSGKETGIIGYWPLDEAFGKIAVDKVHKRNATVNAEWSIIPTGYACSFNKASKGKVEMNFSDIAFSEDRDFTIELWFKSKEGKETCLISNGRGDNNDVTLYYISLESLAQIVKVTPLETDFEKLLTPLLNKIYSDVDLFLKDVALKITPVKAEKYKEQILRFAKVNPTYWSINTNTDGELWINNNSKTMVCPGKYFDDQWHHLALVVQRIGNTRLFVDGELKASEPSTEWSGFGGPKLFFGARAMWKDGKFEFDQYFDGVMDEIRIWSSALKQDQLNRNKTMRLDGDELGLVAYFPFESYEELMGAPVLNPKIGDFLSIREVLGNSGTITQKTNVPNIRMSRPYAKVDFDFVSKPDQIAFTLNEPVKKIQNCILDITTKNIPDLYGNKMVSPVTWSAYIDLNQMKWKEEKFDLEKKLYDPLTFTATVKNSSGKQQNFRIENLPEWLEASPAEGSLDPLTSVEIVFTVNEGLNIGRYSQNINLATDFEFNEKLLLNLRVYKDLPFDWQFDRSKFEYSMNVVGRVLVENVVSVDKYDKVAAFVNGECRGIANLQYIPDYDMYEVFLDVYSNKEAGEQFELRIWDASAGVEYTHIEVKGFQDAPIPYFNEFIFKSNESYGTPAIPLDLKATRQVIQKIALNKGWNWLSFNLTMDENKPFAQQLNGLSPSYGDMIKGLTSFSQYTSSWMGTLNYLNNKEMYMFKQSKGDTLIITGYPVNTETTPILIEKGWNWIGYTPQVSIEINEALGRFNPNQEDLIKSQYAFAIYDQYMGWLGSLKFLRPNDGYMYRYVPKTAAIKSQSLIYPKQGRFKSDMKDNYQVIKSLLDTVNIYNYLYNMTVVATVKTDDNHYYSGNYALGVFSNGELRGIALPQSTAGYEYPLYFVMTYSNTSDEELTFKLLSDNQNELNINEKAAFKIDNILGTPAKPLILTVKEEKTGIYRNVNSKGDIACQIYPNPFSDHIDFTFSLPQKSDVRIDIIDIQGKAITSVYRGQLSAGKSTITWNCLNKKEQLLKKGFYLARIWTDYGQIIRKITKISD